MARDMGLLEKVRALEPAVKRCWATAVGLSSDLEGFSMESQVVFISSTDEVSAVSLTALPSRILTSSAFSHPLIAKFKVIEAEQGWVAAWDALATDDAEGELFCELWDRCVEDQAAGVKLTTAELVDMAVKVREGMASSPRFAVVVWDRPGKQSVLWGEVAYTP